MRVWRQLTAACAAEGGPARHALRVLQYNVLADTLAQGSQAEARLVECPGHFREADSAGVHYFVEAAEPCHVFRTARGNLAWRRRLPMLLREIEEHAPDVITLQEVDHFGEFESALQSKGYEGRFFKKLGRRAHDGSAIFWRVAMLSLLAWQGVRVSQRNIMTGLMVRLQTRRGAPLVVCSTHLKAGFSPEMEAERLPQAKELLRRLGDFAGSDPVVLGADLNANCRPYLRCTARQCCDPAECVEPLVVPWLEGQGFRSAYGGYPSFTTWGGWQDRDVKAVLDYILLRGPLLPHAFLALPPDSLVAEHPERLPNAESPSDHLCLVADVVLPPPEAGAAEAGLDASGHV